MLVPVILAGGSGTRLWPLSREAYPKQFMTLLEGQSLFQHTLARLSVLPHVSQTLVVGNEQHRFLMAEQIRQSGQDCAIILEPSFKNTAPAVALAAMQALTQYNQDVLLLVLPADHLIKDKAGFARSIQAGMHEAQRGKLVTFGITPTTPETGYGYIEKGSSLPESGGFTIAAFKEKPDARTAQRYMDSGNYLWNSGMFLFSAATFIQELSLHEPQMYQATKEAIDAASFDRDFIRPLKDKFDQCPANSIDYAIMENTRNGVVIPLQCAWDDVGAWDAVAQLYDKDNHQNACIGDVITQASHNCLIQSSQRLVVAVGVDNLVIIETPDAVLVLDKEHSQELKPIVAKMRDTARKEVIFHRRVSRPWGAFESIDDGERFQVKRITVAVGEKLSLQRHHHRSEHWVVVKGTARVTRGEEVFLLSENQSTYIPIGVNHRLENVGKIPLEIIEVQSGTYLGEDDIVRLDDQYGRHADVLPLSG